MENASKALLMAGEILIAVLIIGALMYMFTSASQMFKTNEEVDQLEQITEFNRDYESFNRKLLRGTELISVGNKASSNNKKYEGEQELQIAIKFELIDELTYYESGTEGKLLTNVQYKYIGKSGDEITVTNLNNNKNIVLDKTAFDDLKRRTFNCIGTKYHTNTGRIYEMTFKEQKVYNINDLLEGL